MGVNCHQAGNQSNTVGGVWDRRQSPKKTLRCWTLRRGHVQGDGTNKNGEGMQGRKWALTVFATEPFGTVQRLSRTRDVDRVVPKNQGCLTWYKCHPRNTVPPQVPKTPLKKSNDPLAKPHLTDEETEAQRGKVTCPGNTLQARGQSPSWNSRGRNHVSLRWVKWGGNKLQDFGSKCQKQMCKQR